MHVHEAQVFSEHESSSLLNFALFSLSANWCCRLFRWASLSIWIWNICSLFSHLTFPLWPLSLRSVFRHSLAHWKGLIGNRSSVDGNRLQLEAIDGRANMSLAHSVHSIASCYCAVLSSSYLLAWILALLMPTTDWLLSLHWHLNKHRERHNQLIIMIRCNLYRQWEQSLALATAFEWVNECLIITASENLLVKAMCFPEHSTSYFVF